MNQDRDMFDEFFAQTGFDEENEFMPLISVDDEDESYESDKFPTTLPILALKNTVLFPGIVIPITVGRDKSIKAINKAFKQGEIIGVLSQKDTNEEDPGQEDLFRVGTLAKILKLLRMPDGTTTAILQGKTRFALQQLTQEDPYLEGQISILEYLKVKNNLEFEAQISSVMDLAKEIIELSPHIPSEAMTMLKNINNPSFLLNFIASNLGTKIQVKQKILEINDLSEKANLILQHMNSELQLLEL